MKAILAKLFHLSPQAMYQLASNPSMIPVRMYGPREMGPVEAALQINRDLESDRARQFLWELNSNHDFFDELNRIYVPVRRRRVQIRRWNELLYILIRSVRPRIMVETGVFDGQSSAVILQAMRVNGDGMLYSIDLPADEAIAGSTDQMFEDRMPTGAQPGWMIPDRLREQHRLEYGDAKILLPKLLDAHPAIDCFMHDSLHTLEHMRFEYNTAWPHLRSGGMLLSDDVFWNAAFYRFCSAHGLKSVAVDGFGAARKP